MIDTVKRTNIASMPKDVAADFCKFVKNIYVAPIMGYHTFCTPTQESTFAYYPVLTNWLMNNGVDYDEEVLIFYYPSYNGG